MPIDKVMGIIKSVWDGVITKDDFILVAAIAPEIKKKGIAKTGELGF